MGKQIEQLSISLPKFSHPNIFSALMCNRTLTQFAKVSPSKYMCRAILPFPTNVLHYTVCINTDDYLMLSYTMELSQPLRSS